MIAISIGNGSGDGQGSERGHEYDTMSGLYAEFVESEVLPLVEKQYNVKLTKDPEGRATMGGSSGGSCALIMAWYHPELYRRVLTYSGTYVNQQWPWNPESPHGAWGFHERLIPKAPPNPCASGWKSATGTNFNALRDNMHDWVVANENMAKVLAAKGYRYQFVFARNAGHVDRAVKQQTLPEALEYLWQGYPSPTRAERRLPDLILWTHSGNACATAARAPMQQIASGSHSTNVRQDASQDRNIDDTGNFRERPRAGSGRSPE